MGLNIRPLLNSERSAHLEGAAVYDDIAQGPLSHEVVEARIRADDAQRALGLFQSTFGSDDENTDRLRRVFQAALDDYRRTTGARSVIGFEFRRYIKNRPSSQFEAYTALGSLDALFRYHRRSGPSAAEYRRIQRDWLLGIVPYGISLDEFAEVIYPSRYVRGSDVLDIFGD